LSDALPRYHAGLEGLGDAGGKRGDDHAGNAASHNEHTRDGSDRDPAADASRDATSRAMVEGMRAGLSRDLAAHVADRAATAAAEGARAGGTKEAGDLAAHEVITRDLETMKAASMDVKPSTVFATLNKIATPFTAPIHAAIEGPLTPVGLAAQAKAAAELDAARTRAAQQKAMERAVDYQRLGTEEGSPRQVSDRDFEGHEGSYAGTISHAEALNAAGPLETMAPAVDVAPVQPAPSGGSPLVLLGLGLAAKALLFS
jgi:hypothetical protein